MAVNEALPFDEPEDDVAVARAEPAHGPQAVEDGPSMWMRALAVLTLQGPQRRVLGQCRAMAW